MAAENRDGDANLEKTAAELARSMAREHPINGAMLIRTLRQGQVPLFEALFEEWSGVAMPRRAAILYGAGGEGLAISCVALGVSKQRSEWRRVGYVCVCMCRFRWVP